MKKTLAILAALTTLGITLPSDAKAEHGYNRRVVNHTACGRPVYATYRIVGYDRCGNPVGQWVTENANCGCNTCNPRRPSYSGNQYQGGSCAPSYGGSRSGFTFRFGW